MRIGVSRWTRYDEGTVKLSRGTKELVDLHDVLDSSDWDRIQPENIFKSDAEIDASNKEDVTLYFDPY